MGDAITVLSSAAIQALSPILMALGTAALAQAFGWLRAHSHSAAATTALSVLDNITTTVVTELEQTVVASLKATHPDGKLTGVDGEALKKAALGKIQSLYGPHGLDIVAKALKVSNDQVLTLVGSKIEAAVYQTGMAQAAVGGEASPIIKVVTAPQPVPFNPVSPGATGEPGAVIAHITGPSAVAAMSTPSVVASDAPSAPVPSAVPTAQASTPGTAENPATPK